MVDQEPIPDEKLLAEISRLADELEKVPSFQDMNQHGTYSAPPYIRAFGSWNKAVEAAGYSSRASRDHHTREALLAEITRVADICDKKPTLADMAEHSDMSRSTYHNRFDSWNDALEAAGFSPRTTNQRISDYQLKQTLRELATDVGRRPTTTDMKEHGPYSPGVYINRFGSWDIALQEASVGSHNA